MADESQMRMEALKKAYAEIILNTSKEAATRVMAAERKALCYHHDLVSLKEESLRMFLLLKENFNSKITETEARSYNQQMKIEELEAQLSEAEGIIVDLREELKQVHEKLEVVRHTQKQSLSGHVLGVEDSAYEHVVQGNALTSSPLVTASVSDGKSVSVICDTKVPSLQPIAQINKCCDTVNNNSLSDKSHLDQFQADNCDFASIIIENGETELYKNGCTQRVRAFDRNLLNINLPSPCEDPEPMINGPSENKIDSLDITDGLTLFAERMDSGQTHISDKATVQNREKKRGKISEELNTDCLKMLKTSGKEFGDVSFSEARLRTVNFSMTTEKEPFLVCSSETGKKNVKIPSASEYKDRPISSHRRSAQKNSKYRDAIAVLRRSSRRNCIKSNQKPVLAEHKTPSSDGNSQSFGNPREIAEKGSRDTEFYCESLSDELGTTIEIKVSCGDVVTSGEKSRYQEGDAAKSTEGFSEKLYPVFVDAMLMGAHLFDVPISEGFGNTQAQSQPQPQPQPRNDRHLKFTFQRKRRKNVLGKLDENMILDRGTVESGVDKPTDVLVLENHTLKDGLNGDGGVMQVSHQLASLSGKGS